MSLFWFYADRDRRARRRVFGGVFEQLPAGFLDQAGIDIHQRQVIGEFGFDLVRRQSPGSLPDRRVDDVPGIGPFKAWAHAACGYPRRTQEILNKAVEFGDVLLVVVPYTAVEQIGKDYGKALAAKQLVVDVSNPILQRDGAAIVNWVAEQGGAGLATAKLLSGAHLVRGFNAINYVRLAADAHRPGEPVGVPIAGDDPNAIALATRLIKEIGFEPVPVGGLSMGKYLVPGTPLGGEHSPTEIQQIASMPRPETTKPLNPTHLTRNVRRLEEVISVSIRAFWL